MDKVIFTQYTLKEIAEALFEVIAEKDSIININSIKAIANNVEKEIAEYLTREETANLCKVKSLTTLWNWEKQGLLVPHCNAGRKPLYLREDVNKFLNRKQN